MEYEKLLDEIQKEDINILEMKFKGNFKALYSDNTIALSSDIDTSVEKCCILAEELGHHFTTFGDILNSSNVKDIRQEKRARNWGYEKLIGIIDLINAYKKGARNRYELAKYLNVTEEFLDDALNHYKEKYGLYYEIDNYIIYFDPLGVLEMF